MAQQRWCCRMYKESHQQDGDRVIIGVRRAESKRRAAKWSSVISSRSEKGGTYSLILPILYWSDDDVWQFIRERGLPYCKLYDEGFKRLGCVMCPLVPTKMRSDAERWPGIARLWRKGMDELWEKKKYKSNNYQNSIWRSKDALWDWWTNPHRGYGEEDCQQPWLFQ
jgi:phosphoadenosine phosphosulfate reductase